MNQPAAWRFLTRKYPQFRKQGAHFTPRGLRDFFRWTWAVAEEHADEKRRGEPVEATLARLFGKRG